MQTSNIDTELLELMDRFRFHPSNEYVKNATILCLVIGCIAAAFIIFTAITSKQHMGLGITAGVMQILGAFSIQQASIQFWKADLFAYKVVTGTESEIYDKMQEATKEMIQKMLPHILLMSLFLALTLVSWIITIVYITKAMAIKPKVFGILALVIHIIRFVFVWPMNLYSPLFGEQLTADIQQSYDTFANIAFLLPALLIGVAGIISFVKRLTGANQQVTEATEANEFEIESVHTDPVISTEETSVETDSSAVDTNTVNDQVQEGV